ncbi:MAG: potassium channel family protein [Bacillota bacterium]|nr:potassium channel family protein [Bacillota bacterium]
MNTTSNRATTYLKLLALVYAVTVGVLMWVERLSLVDALYLATITFTTVGYGDLVPKTAAGKLFLILLIPSAIALIFGVGITLVEEYFRGLFTRRWRRMEKLIDSLSGHYVVCGHGRLGTIVVEELRRAGKQVVVIDRVGEKAEELGQLGIPFVHGNALRQEVLERAGVARAAGVIVTFEPDEDNTYVVLEAVDLNPDAEIIAAASNAEAARKLYLAGATRVVSPMLLGGTALARCAIDPSPEHLVPAPAARVLRGSR